MKKCTFRKFFLYPTLSLFLVLLSSCNGSSKKTVTSFEAMNTFMTIQSYGKNSQKINNEVQQMILNLEDEISTTKDNSFIYKINNNQGTYIEVPEDTKKLVGFGKEMAEKTNGALNLTLYPIIKAWGFTTGSYRIPSTEEINSFLQYIDYSQIEINENRIRIPENMMIDLGAIGKGYAGDKTVSYLKGKGITSALLDFGGNIHALGAKPDGSDWTIGIKNPYGGNAIAGVKINNQAVITSGGYERYFVENEKTYIHIFDGKTGYPVENDIVSVTVICDSGIYGDALSTALFVMGSTDAIRFWKEHRDFEMILLTKSNQIIYTKPLAEKMTIFAELEKIEVN